MPSLGMNVRAGAGINSAPPGGTTSGMRFPGVVDTSATLIGGPSNMATKPTVLGSPATWIALGAAAYLVVAYLCFHHY